MVVVVNAVKKEVVAVYGRVVVQDFFHFIGTTPHPSLCCFIFVAPCSSKTSSLYKILRILTMREEENLI